MENPATWGTLEKIINEALEEADRRDRMDLVGLSRVRIVADALRKAGLVKDDVSSN